VNDGHPHPKELVKKGPVADYWATYAAATHAATPSMATCGEGLNVALSASDLVCIITVPLNALNKFGTLQIL